MVLSLAQPCTTPNSIPSKAAVSALRIPRVNPCSIAVLLDEGIPHGCLGEAMNALAFCGIGE